MSRKDAASLSAEALAKSRRQKIRNALIWLTMLVIAGSIWWLFFRNQLTPELGKVEKGTARSVVYGTLLVEPVSQSLIKAQTAGVVSSVKVKKGDTVKEGDILAEITDSEGDQRLAQAQNELKVAQEAEKIGPPSKPAFDAKKSGMAQLDRLLKEGNIAQSEYDRNQAELTTLQERLQSEQLTLDAALQATQQKLDVAQKVLENRIIHATQTGVVMDFYSQLGQLIGKNEQMFLIGSQASQISAKVNEEDVGLLSVGMTAVVHLYSFSGKNFSAKVKQVLPGAVDQTYSVVLTLDNPPDGLLNGMSGELNIITGVHENVLTIPTRAIRSGVTPTVLVVVDGVVGSREIKIGYHGIESTEIVEGLNEGDLVILSDLDLYKPGDHVRVVRH